MKPERYDNFFLLIAAFFLRPENTEKRPDDVMMTSQRDDVIMTSQRQTSAKLSIVIHIIDIFLLCKFEFIWIIQT